MKKRLFRITLSFMSLFLGAAMAGCTPTGKVGTDGFIYYGGCIMGYCGDKTESTIPLEYNGKWISRLGNGPHRFVSAPHLKKITIQRNIILISRGFVFDAGVQRESNDSKEYTLAKDEDGKYIKLQLEEINVTEDNKHYMSIDGVVYKKGDSETVYFPPAKKSFTVPDFITTVKNDWFKDNNDLINVFIPSETMVFVESNAFAKFKNIYVQLSLLEEYQNQYANYADLFEPMGTQ